MPVVQRPLAGAGAGLGPAAAGLGFNKPKGPKMGAATNSGNDGELTSLYKQETMAPTAHVLGCPRWPGGQLLA
jgi:hypothetical protein